jgi:hypothetical protein
MVYRVLTTANEAQALVWLADPTFDPRSTVILEMQPAIVLPDVPPAGSEVMITEYLPEKISLSVNSPADGILVVSEWYYPGWEAVVDGQPVRIWEADAGLRAIPLESGEHEVMFVYRPASFLGGLAVTITALGAIASIFVYSMLKGWSGG